MQRRHLIQTAGLSAIALATALSLPVASAQDNKFKIGLILPMTGQLGLHRPPDRGRRASLYHGSRTATPWPARRSS